MKDTLVIGGTRIEAGQRITIDLPIAYLYTHTEVMMPVQVLHGRRPGPRLFISAAIHGDEINGVEIIRRLLQMQLMKRLRGTLLLVPVVNVFGFLNRSRYLPDRRDLNRLFPGSETGSLPARIADIFMQEIVANSTHGIDLHTGSNHRRNLPQVRAYLSDPETAELAHAFGAPIILDANLRDGSLRQAVLEKSLPVLLYEGGEALRFDEAAIRVGVRGILSVMRLLGMLPKTKRRGKRPLPALVANSSTWRRAPIGGILRSKVRLGSKVHKGDILGYISDPFGENEAEVKASAAGIIIGRTYLPLVNEGEALFHIASFENLQSAEIAAQTVYAQLDPERDFAPL